MRDPLAAAAQEEVDELGARRELTLVPSMRNRPSPRTSYVRDLERRTGALLDNEHQGLWGSANSVRPLGIGAFAAEIEFAHLPRW